MRSPEMWRWIWLVTSAVFLTGELLTPGTFFLVCFAIGAALAAALAFLGVGVAVEWVAFLAGSAAAFGAFFPLRRRLDRGLPQEGFGAGRLIGQAAVVTRALPAGDAGMVRVGREEWRAEAADGSAVAEGAVVSVIEVRGTRVIVGPPGPPEAVAPNPWELP